MLMPGQLKISLGQHSDKGRKEINQDFHGACVPEEPALGAKGIAIALADGISSSNVSQIASQSAVRVFLEDYYCTSPAWSVKKSAQQVLMAVNSWLFAQTQQSPYRYEKDRGYVCTLSALVLKSTTAHLFHAGDSRIYRLRDGLLEQLTNDHTVRVSSEQSFLSRALGIHSHLDIDYRSLRMEQGDVFLFTTDGVHEHASARVMINAITDHAGDLDAAARLIVHEAHERGSQDNLTTVIARVDAVPQASATEVHRQLTELPFPPPLAPRMVFDDYTIVRELHASSRSHVYLATGSDLPAPVVIKTLSTELQADVALLDRFLMEDWVAQRISNAHVVKAAGRGRKRNFLYTVTEFIDGQTLHQWLIDNPRPSLETVRGIVAQIAVGAAGLPPPGDAAPGCPAAERDDRCHRHGEAHRLRFDAGGGYLRNRHAPGTTRNAGHAAVHGAGVLHRRERHDTLRSVLAGRDHLPAALWPAPVWRGSAQGAHARRAAAARLPVRARR